MKIRVRQSNQSELNAFCEIEKQPHARQFINATNLAQHRKDFDDPNLIYLSIDNATDELVGYFILAFSPKTKSVEFRRIIIDQKQLGVGQVAIKKTKFIVKRSLAVKKFGWMCIKIIQKGYTFMKNLHIRNSKKKLITIEPCLSTKKLSSYYS